ncbi:MAG: glycosyltransferase [Lachnospiraceae bacterium]|nr:glycosyltransferase [Lachnospiraceae bacterium]
MILQKIQFPGIGESERSSYIRYNNMLAVLDSTAEMMELRGGCELNFNTYFNSFSYEKWMLYSKLDNLGVSLRFSGSVELSLTRYELGERGSSVEEYVLYSEKIESNGSGSVERAFPACLPKGILAFKLRALKDTSFYSGAYITEVDEENLREINLAICICTYRREAYITKNMEMLTNHVFQNEKSCLHGHLQVYIADNGQTLDIEGVSSENIKVVYNLNSGGSGGFTRGILEAFQDQACLGTSHVILMDDDVVFTQHALERLYAFQKMLKPEWENAMLGGSMLRLDKPNVLHAAGESWRDGYIIFNKYGLDINKVKNVLRSDIIESVDYLGWWFCCMPLKEELRNNLSLPLFVQRDDVEHNLRMADMPKLTLNGICLWHESFEKKWSSLKNYYTIRNDFILAALYSKLFSKRFLRKYLLWLIKYNCLIYRYKEADMVMDAYEDFFKGFQWLAEQNPNELNLKVIQSAYKLQDLSELPVSMIYNEFVEGCLYSETKVKRLWRKLVLNGWMLPAGRKATVPVGSPHISKFYRVRTVLNYDDNTQKGFVTEKSYKEVFRILKRMFGVLGKINKDFDKTVKRYRDEAPSVVTEDFWRKYLGVEEEK